MEKTETAYLSLGSNLGNRIMLLQQAILQIAKTAGNIVAISSLYENPAWGFGGADFLNLCIALETQMKPEALLKTLLKIEQQYGRQRNKTSAYESRTVDIDIIYYGRDIISAEHLVVPHPKMHERRFVLRPLADIAPQFYHPILQKDTRNLLQECRDKSVMDKKTMRLAAHRTELYSKLQFYAIEGNIGAGKTTLAHKIAGDFNAKLVLERFADNPFLPKFYEDSVRYAFPLEMSFLADRYQQFTDDTSQFDLFKNFMVSDYDIFKSLIFANVTLQQEEFKLYRKLFNLMYKEVRKPDIYIYLYQTTDRLLENIRKRGRDYEQQIEAAYLSDINRGYLDFIKGNPNQNSLIIDLGELDFVNHEGDYETLLLELDQKVLQLIF